MNFKEWLKVSEDDKKVTLRHPKGHQMTILTYALPKIQREQIKRLKMARGGEVGARSNDALDSGPNNDYGISEQGATVRHANKQPTERGRLAHMKNARIEAQSRAKFEKSTVKPKLKGLAEGGDPAQAPDMPDSQAQDPTKSQAPVVVNVQAPQAQPPVQAPQPPVNMQPVSQSPPVDPDQVTLPEPKQVNGSSLGKEASTTLQGVEDAKAGTEGQALVDAAKARALVPAKAEQIQAEQNLVQRNQNNRNMINQHTQEFNDWALGAKPGDKANAMINPNHWAESQGSAAKVTTAMGLFLGGMSVPFGGHNYAFDHMEKQIDRDIDAQKQNVENRKTVLGAWQSLYGDNNISDNLAKASMNDIYAKKMELTALQMGTQQAKINAQMGIHKLNAESENLRNNAAALATKSGMNGQVPQKPAQGSSGPGASNSEENHPLRETILNSGAENKLRLAQFDPILKNKLPELMQQYTQAQQADIALKKVNDTFQRLDGLAEEGGISGRMRRRVSPHALGGVGAAVGAGVGAMAGGVGAIPGAAIGGGAGEALGKAGEMLTDTDTNRGYDSAQTELKGYLSSALANTTVGGGSAIDDIVAKNSPEQGDSNYVKAHKLKAIRDFIIEHTPRSLLQMSKMTNK